MAQATRRRVLALAAPAALLALSGCQSQSTAQAGGDMNEADRDFVTQIYQLIDFDRQEGELAPTYATTPAVKQIAAKLVADANNAQSHLDPVVKSLGFIPPPILRSDLKIRLFTIRRQQGIDFDRTFIDDQIASHQEYFDRYNMMMTTPGQNPQLVALGNNAMPIVRRNLAELRAIQKQMMVAS